MVLANLYINIGPPDNSTFGCNYSNPSNIVSFSAGDVTAQWSTNIGLKKGKMNHWLVWTYSNNNSIAIHIVGFTSVGDRVVVVRTSHPSIPARWKPAQNISAATLNFRHVSMLHFECGNSSMALSLKSPGSTIWREYSLWIKHIYVQCKQTETIEFTDKTSTAYLYYHGQQCGMLHTWTVPHSLRQVCRHDQHSH